MDDKGFNQIRLVIGLISLAMLIFMGLAGVMSVVDCCLFILWLVAFVLLSKKLECVPWMLGLTAFYMAFLFLGYHCPLLVWDAPEPKMFVKIVLYGNQLMSLLVNAFLYFIAVVAFFSLVCAAISGFYCFNKKHLL